MKSIYSTYVSLVKSNDIEIFDNNINEDYADDDNNNNLLDDEISISSSLNEEEEMEMN